MANSLLLFGKSFLGILGGLLALYLALYLCFMLSCWFANLWDTLKEKFKKRFPRLIAVIVGSPFLILGAALWGSYSEGWGVIGIYLLLIGLIGLVWGSRKLKRTTSH